MARDDLQKKIKDFAKKKGTVTIPEIQVEFNLEYKDVAPIVYRLVEQKFMWLKSGLEYKVFDSSYTWQELRERMNNAQDKQFVRLKQSEERDDMLPPEKVKRIAEGIATPGEYDDDERFVLKALAFCIVKKGACLADLKSALSCTYMKAYRTIDWMVNRGYVYSEEIDKRNYYKTTITKQKFEKKFGILLPEALRYKSNNSENNGNDNGENDDDGENLTKEQAEKKSEAMVSNFAYEDYKDSEQFIRKLIYTLSTADPATKFNFKTRWILSNHGSMASRNYSAMFRLRFDMNMEIARVPQLDRLVGDVISSARTNMTIFGKEWSGDKKFESLCMEVIVRIISISRSWQRADAVTEAAREVVALRYANQSNEASNVHSRVLYEFLDGSDEDYERLKKLIWE